jgi:hypothetical protein
MPSASAHQRVLSFPLFLANQLETWQQQQQQVSQEAPFPCKKQQQHYVLLP